MRNEFKREINYILKQLARTRKALAEVEGTSEEVDRYITSRFKELMEKYDKASPQDLVEDARQDVLRQTRNIDPTGQLTKELERFMEGLKK